MSQMRQALIVAAASPRQLAEIEERPEILIAADSGVHAVLARGWFPDRVVGDLDSAQPAALDVAVQGGAVVDRFPEDKNETDLELAIAAAAATGATHVHVVARGDGRLDHQLANLVALAHPAWADICVSAAIGDHSVWVVRGNRTLDMGAGCNLAIMPVGGPATVTSRGVAYPLDAEVLSPFAGRGIANAATAASVEFIVEDGVVLVLSSPTRANT